MQKSLEKLLKILNLEIQGNYANKAIIGGLDKFFPNWIIEARLDNISEQLLEQIHTHFANYSTMEPAEREISTKTILASLRNLNSSKDRSSANTSLPSTETVYPKAVPSRETNKPSPPDKKPSSTPNYPLDQYTGLKSPVSVLSGIGPAKAKLLHEIGIDKLGDLFYYFPRRYDDYSQLKPINRIGYNEELTIIATVQSFLTTPLKGRNQVRLEVIVSDGTGFLRLVFFRSSKFISSFENHFRRGTQLVISGKVTMYLGRLQMNNPNFEPLDQAHLNTNGIIPIYPLTSGLSQKDIRISISNALEYYGKKTPDHLPSSIKSSAELIDLPLALQQIHFPDSFILLKSAQDRLAFDEIFFLQLGVQQQKKGWQSSPASKYILTDDQLHSITNLLPFSLTMAQQKVIQEIREDLESGHPMNRLIQGDVGSGKTIVAAIASAAVNLHGGQTAFMAPTSILAEQHYQTLLKLLANDGTNQLPMEPTEIQLLTGNSSPQERADIDAGLQAGLIKLLIGTHALIEEPVKFKNLQLAIIDEQHRFGIAQRSALRQKGENPHLLVMSATPIPRSLALTLFGDLDISIIDEMPIGRIPVETQIIHPFTREKTYQIVRDQVAKGHQAFIVYPLIDKGDDEDQKAAVDEHAHLQTDVFPNLKLGLLHGRMPSDEKDQVMQKFHDREFDILVSTTVIEVGMDVPNATVMLIEGANRFGLAQLHQLRGRVGRGAEHSYCLLIPENEDAVENERLAAMIETNDGFILAEKDLAQRGPGDFIGYRQSGYADLRMASITDIRLIEKARHFAQEIFNDDPMLEKTEHQLLAQKLSELWTVDASDIS